MPTRLLLIEDNPGDALIFRERLNESNLEYELVHTQRLREGLELLDAERFDLILVDLSLPDASGIEAVVKVIRAAPDRPVIVLTGLDDANIAAQAREEGAVDYLVKWYHDGPSLARYVRYAIAQVRMQREGRLDRKNTPSAPAPVAQEGASPERAPEREVEQASGDDAHGVLAALDGARIGVVVVTAEREVVYANPRALEWLGDDKRYPAAPEEGFRRGRRSGTDLLEEVVATRWQGKDAFLVTLRRPSASAASDPDGTTLEMAEAALAFVAQSEHRSRWMTGVLQSALDLEQQARRGIVPSPSLIDLVDRTQMIARELHPVALERGQPINVKAAREKISVQTDRQLLEATLRRLLLDAVLTSDGAGVDVVISVTKGQPQLEVAWELSLSDWASVPKAVRTLSRTLLERLVERAGGACAHTERGGKDVISITFAENGAATGART